MTLPTSHPARLRHVLCAYPAHGPGAPAEKYVAPIGLEYVARAIRDQVGRVTVVDMRFEPGLDRWIAAGDVDLVCLSVNHHHQHETALAAMRRLPQGIPVVAGGRHATVSAETLLGAAPNLVAVVRGDGEDTILDIVAGMPLGAIPGISFKDGECIVHNEARKPSPLDDRLYPDRRMRRVNYRMTFHERDLGVDADLIMTSRGCPFSCRFCTFAADPLGQRRTWTARSARSVVEELKEIAAEFVYIVDENFPVDLRRVVEICGLIQAEGVRKVFGVTARVEIYRHPDVLRCMYQAGFRLLMMGFESAQDKTLEAMHKGFDTAGAARAMAEIRRIGFFVHGSFLIGCIGETETEMLQIASHAKRLGLDAISLHRLRADPGSPLNEVVGQSEGYYVGPKNYVCSEAYPDAKLRDIRHRIARRYYTLPTLLRIGRKILTTGLVRPGHALRAASSLALEAFRT